MRPWKLPATNRSNLNPGRHGLSGFWRAPTRP